MRLPYLFSPQWLLWAACTLSIYYLIFLYHVNQCRVQLGTNKVVVVVELLLLLQAYAFGIDRHYTHGWFCILFIFPPIFEKVVKWGTGSFEFYLLVRVISSWMPFDPGPFKGCYSVTSAERTFLMRQEVLSRRNVKTSFPNRCNGIFLHFGWVNRGMIEKARQDLETNISSWDKQGWTIEAKLTWVTGPTTRRAWRHTFTKSDRR